MIIIPINPGDSEDLEFIPDEPIDLIDKRIDFIFLIDSVTGLPEDMCRDIYIEYSLFNIRQSTARLLSKASILTP